MDSNIDRVIEEALALPPEERAEVAIILRNSIESDIDEEAIDAAWVEESVRRMEEIESGRVTAIPWEEARARLSAL